MTASAATATPAHDHAPAIQPARPDDNACWAAVCDRDAGADGRFWYAVRTTGIYCRPSCVSRMPRRENVSFHASPAAAEAAGYRPCKRCRPQESAPGARHAAAIARACALIEQAETVPDLTRLAAAAGISRFHFHRLFKAHIGLTPRAYAAARQKERVRAGLASGASVTTALHDAGFSSSGRFYAGAAQALGMTPATYRAHGTGQHIRYAVAPCSLGLVLVAATSRGICAITLGDDADSLVNDLQERFRAATLTPADAGFNAELAAVVTFVDAPAGGLALPLDIRGTAFQERVWQALQRIPAGHTASYAEIAAAIGQPQAARAVAAACAANHLAVAIPCHRVVRNDGSLSGYRWGVARKAALLAREGER